MQYRRRLRSRIIVSFLIFGTVLSGLFAISAFILQDYITDQLISRTLEDELDSYVLQLRRDPSVVEPFSTRIDGYVTRPGRAEIVPAVFRDLPTGVHEVDNGGKSYRAAIRKEDDFWVFLTYDVTADRKITRTLLVALLGVVLLFSALSYGLGRWSSGRVMSPVRELAWRVREMGSDVESDKARQPLSQHFADDEVGQLAAALDDYSQRLRDLVERDKAFNADVSHELRTPLAVITGATELLLNMPDQSAKVRERLLRIARAARQSTDITTALLHLVRAERGTTEDSSARNVGDIVEEVAELHRPLIGNKPLEIVIQHSERVSVIAPEAVIAVTVGNLLGNAIRYTPQGQVNISVGNGSVIIHDTGPGIAPEDLPKVFERHYRGHSADGKGAGLGLAIVKRLCELYGWRIHFSSPTEGGLRALIEFYPERRGGAIVTH
ncbi:MAG: HAMP domain-containing sensor histidine kinase [Wenzhouxiangellaceae bacterium]